MNKFAAFFKLIRWPNLVMLGMVQIISQFVFVPAITAFHLLLISLATILIAAGGYLINDYYDYDLDIANGKKPFFVKSSLGNLSIVYSVLGLAIGFYVSYISSYLLFPFFIFAFVILWFYAFFFSKYKILGNILISILIAEAIFIIPAFEYLFSTDLFPSTSLKIIEYAILAFLFNWLREIVKDLEDQKGDALFNRKTLPILLGEFNTKMIVVVLVLAINLFLYQSNFGTNLYIIIPIAISSLLLMFGIINAHETKEFKLASLFIKLMMLYGLLSPLF